MKRDLILLALLCFFVNPLLAQTQQKYRYWDDVQTIKKFDEMYKPPVHPILFVGSSSIRKWDDLLEAFPFPKYGVLNRGIGGAVVNDITYYLNDIVFPYQPRQIVLYVGENDVVNANVTADSIFNRTVRLYHAIRARLPQVPIVYIAMKPSPIREKYVQKVIDGNRMISSFFAGEKNVVFADIYPLMIKDGKARTELFSPDMLHMNRMGYKLWEEKIEPYLLKNTD